jgi:hypothetical protein
VSGTDSVYFVRFEKTCIEMGHNSFLSVFHSENNHFCTGLAKFSYVMYYEQKLNKFKFFHYRFFVFCFMKEEGCVSLSCALRSSLSFAILCSFPVQTPVQELDYSE